MDNQLPVSALGMYVVNACLIVQAGDDVDERDVKGLGKTILDQVKTTGIKRILINVSSLKVMDSFTFVAFKDIATALALLGAAVVFVGFQPGVASALIDLDVPLDNILTAITMEDGFTLLNSRTPDLSESVEWIDDDHDLDFSDELPADFSGDLESDVSTGD